MANEPRRCVARVDKSELSELPAHWTDRERGRYLRRLLRRKGIEPDRLYRVEYFPKHLCWVLTQDTEPDEPAGPAASFPAQADAAFYLHAVAEFRRTARAAFVNLAAHSSHFAFFGCPYQLPERPQETTPAALAQLLGESASPGATIRFDGEGGWRVRPSAN